MANSIENGRDDFQDDDHRVAYVFNPDEDESVLVAPRPSKRRKLSSKKSANSEPPLPAKETLSSESATLEFVPLLNGAEKPECVSLRRQLFAQSWAAIDGRIQDVLRESNRSTLDAVASFVRDAPGEVAAARRIPAALIITGPNIASQDMLFEQLSESLGGDERFVRIRSAEAVNFKGTLKKIVRDVTRRSAGGEEDDVDVAVGQDGRKYLDYDLEALHAFIKPHESKQVIVAFQDSEAFDNGLLSELITLFSSWSDRIQFTLLFGIATSVELFQARLLKSTARYLYGSQFDVVQTSSVLESIFKCAIAHAESPLRLGASLLSSLVERQQSQVAGIQVFTSSLKYAYMCEFYANPLAIFLSDEPMKSLMQPEHVEAIRSLPSFRTHVEDAVEAGQLEHARSMLEDDGYLLRQVRMDLKQARKWKLRLLRSLQLIVASEVLKEEFTTLYINALADGIDVQSEESKFIDSVKRMPAEEIISLTQRLVNSMQSGNPEIGLEGWEGQDETLLSSLSEMAENASDLKSQAMGKGNTLRSQYSSQSKVLRTTVVAQKVQLRQDTSTLTDEDKAFTELVDSLTEFLSAAISCEAADTVFLHEIWLYDSKTPHKDVFIPRPWTVFERALSRPHDYLSCACCSNAAGGSLSTLPATSILYHLYQETGALVNVSDLWSAFFALVGGPNADGDHSKDSGLDERTALVLFYRALAELKAMGFVKATKKKADHIAKLKWL